MYRIIYNQGEIFIHVSTTKIGEYSAQLIDPKNSVDTTLSALNENEIYDKCLSWASSNIYGGFALESFVADSKLNTNAA